MLECRPWASAGAELVVGLERAMRRRVLAPRSRGDEVRLGWVVLGGELGAEEPGLLGRAGGRYRCGVRSVPWPPRRSLADCSSSRSSFDG